MNSDLRNLLIQGDCLSACAYLKSKNIKIDLVYIDPPFASGANYAKKIYLRNGGKSEIDADDSSIGEEVMYGDIWQKEDYLNWLYERLLAIKKVMSESSSIYVHLDATIGHYVKVLLDEVFGEDNFINEVIWKYVKFQMRKMTRFANNTDRIFIYSKNDTYHFNPQLIKLDKPKKLLKKGWDKEKGVIANIKDEFGKTQKIEVCDEKVDDLWNIPFIGATSGERVDYSTQKPEKLLERIINTSSNKNMIVADLFSGSGTTAKVANDLGRKFIACDIGINAIQSARDRLIREGEGVGFDILKIQDGLRLFRNPAQTMAKIFSIIDGFKSRSDLNLNEFWDGGIAQSNGSYTPVKFSGIHEKLTKELLGVYLEEIYQLENVSDKTNDVIIIYAHKDIDIDQAYLNKQLNKTAKTTMKVKLISLDSLLGEKGDALFMPDNAGIKVSKSGNKYKVEIKQYFSPYLKNKIDDYNVKKTKKGTLEQDLSKAVKISKSGLELIESVQFDTTLKEDVWTSNLRLEDKAGKKEKIKGTYLLDSNKFKIKIRNIAGDEIIIDGKELK
ncbi:MAG: DNA-methyltransferase [Candidatus Scalindua sp.]